MFNKKPSPNVNLLSAEQDPRLHRRTLILVACFTLFVALVAVLGASASYRAAERGTGILSELGQWPVLSEVRQAVFGGEASVPLPKDHRLTFLILGIGGEGHDGPELTDTILLANLDLQEKKVALLSLPRDLAYPLGDGRFEKINAVNAYAEQSFPGEGAKRTAEGISKLLEIRIDHVIRIDFRGFANLVDAVGGVDINVERSFVDPEFPTNDEKWMTVSFKKGPQHMDGATALTFTRSRHGTNDEGSDFARSRRQQLVLLAVREKLLSLGTITDPRKLSALWSAVANNIQTDLTPWDLLKLAPLASEFSADQVSMRSLSDAPGGGLVASNVNGAYMLFPRKPDWSEIREIAQNPFTAAEQKVAETKPAESIRLEIRNGTSRTGFASQMAAKLEKTGYEITAFENASRRGYERTLIFDLTNGKKSSELARLRHTLNADVSLVTPLSNATGTHQGRVIYTDRLTTESIKTNADFFIILGEASYPLLTE